MDLFTVFLCVALVLWGANTFVGERVLEVLGSIAAIIAGFIGLFRMF